jgi:hypothetical protein
MYPFFLSDFNENWIFSTDFRKKAEIPNFIKIRPVGAKLSHADRHTDGRKDLTKLIVAFRNFANAPKNSIIREAPDVDESFWFWCSYYDPKGQLQ